MTDPDFHRLFSALQSEQAKKVISGNSRDRVLSLMLKMTIKKPSLLRFVKYLF